MAGREHVVSEHALGRECAICGKPASHLIMEIITVKDKAVTMHILPFTTDLCCEHFAFLMGKEALRGCGLLVD